MFFIIALSKAGIDINEKLLENIKKSQGSFRK